MLLRNVLAIAVILTGILALSTPAAYTAFFCVFVLQLGVNMPRLWQDYYRQPLSEIMRTTPSARLLSPWEKVASVVALAAVTLHLVA